MSQPKTPKRLVVFVDGTEPQHGQANRNPTNIYRLHSIVGDGPATDSAETSITQVKKYYNVAGKAPRLTDKLKGKIPGDDTDEKIRKITREICSILESPEDELYLFGSAHGSFVVRAVAGVLHHMGLPKRESMSRFEDLYDCALQLLKARAEDDSRNGPRLVEGLRPHRCGPPLIKFVGLLDSVKWSSTSTIYDTTYVDSIKNVRIALALNENRSNRTPETLTLGLAMDVAKHSFIQAWFLGCMDDICGGVQHDGLSLYPLQWILIEAMKTGLFVSPTSTSLQSSENVLALVFPQYAGDLPSLDGSEEIFWNITYTNGIRVGMFDLQATHTAATADDAGSHNLRFDNECYSRTPTRKIFGSETLKGWDSTGAYGTIVHVSVFCILDRFPKYLELNGFRPLKKNLAEYQAHCVLDNATALPPWLEGMQLQASGVKAFRILVCGKTGVGKSTLINKVFGVEMTEESETYDQGVHDINKAFESPSHPGLLIHDSRGWQAGSGTELELIARFLRHRAFQKNAAEALHVIWFCVDADVSRIEEADRQTFETIAQFSHDVPVFVVGTKKDKLVGYRKIQLLEQYMAKTDDYPTALKLASEESNQSAEDQFLQLRTQLSQIKHYKADGYCCLSKDDEVGIKSLVNQTLGLIADERVRLFCVAAQVVDVDQKINAAVTECMRLGTHAIRTAAVPLPLSGLIGTPTVSRLICEHVLQCFGFPKAAPAEIEAIMKKIVMGNMKSYLSHSITQFLVVSGVTIGIAIPTMGIGTIVGAAACILGMPPTARMLLKCSCDMILILERSFRYEGQYVSVKQIEDAALYYTTTTIKTFAGNEKRLQQHVHDQIEALIPLKSFTVGFRFNKLRDNIEDIIYASRFGKPPDYPGSPLSSPTAVSNPFSISRRAPAELDGAPRAPAELGDTSSALELPGEGAPVSNSIVLQRDSSKVLGTLDELTLGGGGVRTQRTELAKLSSPQGTRTSETPGPWSAGELEGNTLIGSPREELNGSTPVSGRSLESPSSTKFKWKPSWLSKKSKSGL